MVPTTATVRAGVRVAIVLKQDQPTGRLTNGVVQSLLTRGNHPRGIKVRLADGRVGRVQRVIDSNSSAGPSQSEMPASAGQEGTGEQATTTTTTTTTTPPRHRNHFKHQRDVRLDDEFLFQPDRQPQRHELADFVVKPARQKAKGRGTAASTTNKDGEQQQQTKLAKCPVCGEFEGDAPAVAHHVAEHFTEAPCA